MNNLHGIKTNDFNIAHLNVRGMVSKIDEVKTLLSQCQFKVLCLSETFLKENIPNSYFDIQGYEVVREKTDLVKTVVAYYVTSRVVFLMRNCLKLTIKAFVKVLL